MRFEFTRNEGCKFRGEDVPVDIYAIRIQDWMAKADGLEEMGHFVHRRLHEEAKRLGITNPPHADDPNHNRYLGAAFEMACAGQAVKATLLYNRWAQMARHRPVELVALDPVTFKMDIGLLKIVRGDIEVTPC
jgi:hypothetical protein